MTLQELHLLCSLMNMTGPKISQHELMQLFAGASRISITLAIRCEKAKVAALKREAAEQERRLAKQIAEPIESFRGHLTSRTIVARCYDQPGEGGFSHLGRKPAKYKKQKPYRSGRNFS